MLRRWYQCFPHQVQRTFENSSLIIIIALTALPNEFTKLKMLQVTETCFHIITHSPKCIDHGTHYSNGMSYFNEMDPFQAFTWPYCELFSFHTYCNKTTICGKFPQFKVRRLQLLQLISYRNRFFQANKTLNMLEKRFPSDKCLESVVMVAWCLPRTMAAIMT